MFQALKIKEETGVTPALRIRMRSSYEEQDMRALRGEHKFAKRREGSPRQFLKSDGASGGAGVAGEREWTGGQSGHSTGPP